MNKLTGAAILLGLAVLAGCQDPDRDSRKVSLQGSDVPAAPEPAARLQKRAIRVALGTMVTPHAGYVFYNGLLKHLEGRLKRTMVLVDRENYREINELIRDGGVEMAFVCGKPYVDGHDSFGMELLVAPQAYGKTTYQSFIIVPKDSGIRTVEQLRGKHFVFSDPMSNSGKLAPTYMLAKLGESPSSFFGRFSYSYAHDKSVALVAHGLADGAAVDSLIWLWLDRKDPALTARTRIIQRSPPYGIPPIVVRPSLDPELKAALKGLFLDAHKTPEGRNLLQGMGIERFVVVPDSAYDSIREMKRFVDEYERKRR